MFCQGLVNGRAGSRLRSVRRHRRNSLQHTVSPPPARPQRMCRDPVTGTEAGRQICACSLHLLPRNRALQITTWASRPGNVQLLRFLWLKAHFQNVITGGAAGSGFLFSRFPIAATQHSPHVYCVCYWCGCCFNFKYMAFRSDCKKPPASPPSSTPGEPSSKFLVRDPPVENTTVCCITHGRVHPRNQSSTKQHVLFLFAIIWL